MTGGLRPRRALDLSQVLRHPDDDSPREEFAKAVEHDNPTRAKFITTQLELSRTPKGTLEWRRLGALATDLLWESRPGFVDWSSEIEGAFHKPFCGYEFNRGFVNRIDLRADDFAGMHKAVFEGAPVQHLTLAPTTSVPLDAEFWGIGNLEKIRSLAVEGCRLKDDDIERLCESNSLGNLNWMSLANNRIGWNGVRLLAKRFPDLRYLNLAGNPSDPRERVAFDQNVLVDRWIPDEGLELEEEFGPISWLRRETKKFDRFSLPGSRTPTAQSGSW